MESIVRYRRMLWLLVGLAAVCGLHAWGTANAKRTSRIDAVRGRHYRLTKQHGPWMIMAAGFRAPPPELRIAGMTPQEAAEELVFELRRKGIPAYTFFIEEAGEPQQRVDRFGRKQRQNVAARGKEIAVLAGNYSSPDDKVAQKTLEYIKKFRPKFLRDEKRNRAYLRQLKSGGRYRKTPGRSGPLSVAMLAPNPLLSQEEVSGRTRDPLLLELNSGLENSLLHNPGKYTLTIASFYGQHVTHLANKQFESVKQQFKISNSLDNAATDAWQLAKYLEETTLPRDPALAPLNLKVYVYHERYRSVVTAGSFDSARDPRILPLAKTFGAKITKDPQTGKEVLTAEIITIPGRQRNAPPLKTWILDPSPQVMEVPRL